MFKKEVKDRKDSEIKWKLKEVNMILSTNKE